MYAVGESERASLGCENEVRGSCVEDLEGGKAAALRKVKVRAGKLGSFICVPFALMVHVHCVLQICQVES